MTRSFPRKYAENVVRYFYQYAQRFRTYCYLLVRTIVNRVAQLITFEIAQSKKAINLHFFTLLLVSN